MSHEEIVRVTQDLMRMRTTADRVDEFERALVYVREFFSSCSHAVIRSYACEGSPSLVVSTHDTLEPTLLLLGHLDVVPGDDALFEPRVHGGRIYGRGGCDMKGPVAAMMMLMREALRSKNDSSVALMLTTDEEIGGVRGANYLVETVGYRPRVVYVPDGGNRLDTIVHQNKGSWTVRISATGKAAHGARPWLGENAIDRLIAAYIAVRDLFPNRLVNDIWDNTCNIGRIEGGRAANQVPASASCLLDMRMVDAAEADRLLPLVQSAVAAHGCIMEILERGVSSYTDPAQPLVHRYASCVEEVMGVQPTFTRNHGADDGRYFSAYNIPVICTRPRSGEQHSNGEWVDVQSLEQLYRVLDRFSTHIRELTVAPVMVG